MSEQASFTAGNALSRKHDKACLNSCFITSDISTTLLSYNFSPTVLSISLLQQGLYLHHVYRCGCKFYRCAVRC